MSRAAANDYFDQILFHTTGLNNSLLQCKVNVSRHPGFHLSISQSGQILNSSSEQINASRYVTLLQTITLRSPGTYQCSLHFNGELTGIVLLYIETTSQAAISEMYPEPWFLYGGLILVQVSFLSVLTIEMLRRSHC
ncbi:hypothetical protein WMY93_026598 [Mugilogobius chulae]|uniref:Immunoglobulin subtype domain-containing protein n=1 Tax=Mugilogobius chulae TaxID=88201 RepID=A0AAW0NAL9_9GOBI